MTSVPRPGPPRPGPPPPRRVLDLVDQRRAARERREFALADTLRDQVRAAGWLIRDTAGGVELVEAPPWEPFDPTAVPRWSEPDQHQVSVIVHVLGWPADVERAVTSLAMHCGAVDYEVLLVDDGAGGGTGSALEDLAAADARVRALHLDVPLGFGAAMNLGMGQASGRYLVWLDPHVEATGDILSPLLTALDEPGTGLAGGWGVVTRSMLEFEADDGPEVDAIEGYLLALPRSLAAEVQVDPKHRYYRNADLDYSFAVRDLHGPTRRARAVRVPVPAARHRHRAYHETDPAERERASKRNYDRFLARWKRRTDLLTRGFTGYHRHPPDQDGDPGTGG